MSEGYHQPHSRPALCVERLALSLGTFSGALAPFRRRRSVRTPSAILLEVSVQTSTGVHMRFWLYLGLIGRIALITLMAYSMYLLIFENVVAPPTLPITDPNR